MRNLLLSAFRVLRRRPIYLLMNVAGLALGIATCLLILLFVRDEMSYDQFHPNADRLYRIALERSYPDRVSSYAAIPMPVGRTLLQDYPEVEAATQVTTAFPMAVRHEDHAFQERGILFADSAFFQVFGITPHKGDPARLLDEPHTIVLTPAMAQKYFGDADPIGKPLELDLGTFTITGIVPALPEHSHLHYDFVASLDLPWLDENDWLDLATTQYIRLAEGTDPSMLETKIPAMVDRYAGEQILAELGLTSDDYAAAGNAYRYFLQPITDIHLKSDLEYELEPNGDITYVYLFAIVALIILCIACVNYVNLSTAQAFERAREVGVRKALGVRRGQLVFQFLAESVAVSLVAFCLAVVLTAMLLPSFNALTGKTIGYDVFGQVWFAGSALGLSILVGILAGAYPAFVLSAFSPAKVLKGRVPGWTGRSGYRHTLVAVQFTLSITLLVGMSVVSEQMQFLLDSDLGYGKEQRVVIERAGALEDSQYAFMEALQEHPGILQASRSNGIPGYNFFEITLAPTDLARSPLTGRFIFTDDTYLETFDIELVAGRPFSRDRASDSLALIINETMAQALGGDNPIGQEVTIPGDRRGSDVRYRIVGVVEDFHHESLHTTVGPVAFRHDQGPRFPLVTVHLASGSERGALRHIERTWRQFAPDQPLDFFFFDQHYDALYASEVRTERVLFVFTVLSMVLACLGLVGLSVFAAAQRTKEIGIRKVLGASVAGIVVLLSKDYLKPIGVALVVAVPLAFVVMRQWLAGFAYQVELGWYPFLMAGGLAVAVAMLATGWQSVRAALADPVRSLRYE